MKFEDLEKINKELQTVDIKGKDYVEVNKRVIAFRKLYPEGSIETEIVQVENGVVIFKAIIKDNEGIVLATGHAYEKENSTFINKTSYIENCETSAVGRALGLLGIGIDTSIASAEEVETAIMNQNKDNKITPEQVRLLQRTQEKYNRTDKEVKEILKSVGVEKYEDLSLKDFAVVGNKLGGN